MTQHHPVSAPRHYQGVDGLEAITVVEAWGLGSNHYLATALCYVLRHRRKGGAEDLAKARWYLRRLLPLIPDRHKRGSTNGQITTDLVVDQFALSPTIANVVTAIYCAAVWEQGRNVREQVEAAIGWLTDEIERQTTRVAPVIVDEQVCA
ncbi:MAG: DUF3310 domain-containing protein [Hyphomicrobiaceae bacterium]